MILKRFSVNLMTTSINYTDSFNNPVSADGILVGSTIPIGGDIFILNYYGFSISTYSSAISLLWKGTDLYEIGNITSVNINSKAISVSDNYPNALYTSDTTLCAGISFLKFSSPTLVSGGAYSYYINYVFDGQIVVNNPTLPYSIPKGYLVIPYLTRTSGVLAVKLELNYPYWDVPIGFPAIKEDIGIPGYFITFSPVNISLVKEVLGSGTYELNLILLKISEDQLPPSNPIDFSITMSTGKI